MMRPSGAGSICRRSSPAGIRGQQMLGHDRSHTWGAAPHLRHRRCGLLSSSTGMRENLVADGKFCLTRVVRLRLS
jgi:hypothetical protein